MDEDVFLSFLIFEVFFSIEGSENFRLEETSLFCLLDPVGSKAVFAACQAIALLAFRNARYKQREGRFPTAHLKLSFFESFELLVETVGAFSSSQAASNPKT